MECKKCIHYRVCLAYSGADELDCCELVNKDNKCDFYEEQAKKQTINKEVLKVDIGTEESFAFIVRTARKKSVMYAFSRNVKCSNDDMGGNVFKLYDLQGNLTAAILENDVEDIYVANMRRWK